MVDTLNIYGVTHTGVTGIKVKDPSDNTLTYTRVSGTKSITENGNNIDVASYEKVNVAVPGTTPTGTKNITITSNTTTTEDVTNYATASIITSVPNTYSAGDEGKVVSNGALVAQTAHADVTPTTSDQTIDTTTNNSIKVKGDANLVAGNIKKDVVIFNTTGSYEGGGGGDYEMEGGTFTLATDSETAGVSVSFQPTHAVCFCDRNDMTHTTGYRCWLSVLANSTIGGMRTTVQSNKTSLAAALVSASLFTYSNGVFTFSTGSNTYTFNAGPTYYWYAWRETT